MRKVRLPKAYDSHAEAIAAAAPRVFRSAESARETMRDLYARLLDDRDIVAASTGGILFRRDGEGVIEMWVSPHLLGATDAA